MIFSSENAQKILAGTKTQTRRLVKSDKPRYKIGHVYAFSDGRRKKALGYIEIVGVRSENLGEISYDDCIAEGIDGIYQWAMMTMMERFKELWDNIHKEKGNRFEDNPLIWMYEFRLVRRGNGK